MTLNHSYLTQGIRVMKFSNEIEVDLNNLVDPRDYIADYSIIANNGIDGIALSPYPSLFVKLDVVLVDGQKKEGWSVYDRSSGSFALLTESKVYKRKGILIPSSLILGYR